MATETTQTATVFPRSGAGGLEPWQALSLAQPGHASLAQKGTPPGHLPPDWQHERPWKRNSLVQGVGVSVHLRVGGEEGGTWGGCWGAPRTEEDKKASSFLA